ncbi:GPW/gp25 family protein [Xanthomonas campestris pv. phormiicola]|nr:GPW/gp25 family protein [Xanthomonas campestris pv. phormiicola]UYC18433.1 GPW/gp25 family protein [Xanthomonas campestris pv. phormiicola]
MAANSDFLGQGWAFPVAVQGGKLQFARGAEDVEQALRIILQTAPGERVMQPEFGCRINELVFSAGNATAVSLAQLYVTQALNRWEPRIRTLRVVVTTTAQQANCLMIAIDYLIRDRNQPANLVYPFFLK